MPEASPVALPEGIRPAPGAPGHLEVLLPLDPQTLDDVARTRLIDWLGQAQAILGVQDYLAQLRRDWPEGLVSVEITLEQDPEDKAWCSWPNNEAFEEDAAIDENDVRDWLVGADSFIDLGATDLRRVVRKLIEGKTFTGPQDIPEAKEAWSDHIQAWMASQALGHQLPPAPSRSSLPKPRL